MGKGYFRLWQWRRTSYQHPAKYRIRVCARVYNSWMLTDRHPDHQIEGVDDKAGEGDADDTVEVEFHWVRPEREGEVKREKYFFLWVL